MGILGIRTLAYGTGEAGRNFPMRNPELSAAPWHTAQPWVRT